MQKPLRVLIAEDEHLILMGIESILKRLGHSIIAKANDGEEAIELVLEKKPDLILMDINLPNLDGIEAIKKINQAVVVPAIIISGYHDRKLLEKAKEAGVFGYLVKPVDERELKAAIEICIARFEEFQSLKKDYEHLKDALEARKYIERAKGILMDRNNLKEPEAMKALQKKSRDSNRKIVEVAKEIIKADNILRLN
ncbi:MAG: two-component system, response regulator PdtaR [Halanaerobiales bacterium]|nr:two-component system, response regulator PdtaR [Halanaerobiales bacterium]